MKHERFADNLKRLMRERGISQNKLYYATGINRENIGKWCAGRNFPSLDSIAKVRLVLGCTWDELLGAKGELVLDEDSMAMVAEDYR